MNKRKNNIELKIYELLGIKKFRKMAFKLRDILSLPFTIAMTKEERHKLLYEDPSNYIMKKGNGVKDLQDFKKQLLLNAGIHLWALSTCVPGFLKVIGGTVSLSTTIIILSCVVINIYCIMLQRYNHIRINRAIKKMLPHEEAKKNKIKEELKKEDSLLDNHTYTIVGKRDKEKSISFQDFLDTATYNELKQYRDYLSYINAYNQMLMEQQDFYESEEYSFSFPIKKNKSLKLELKTNRNNESTK